LRFPADPSIPVKPYPDYFDIRIPQLPFIPKAIMASQPTGAQFRDLLNEFCIQNMYKFYIKNRIYFL